MASITLSPVKSTYISEWYSNQKFGPSTALFISRFKQEGDAYRSLIQFDLDKIPLTSTIEEATLELVMYRNELSSQSILISAHSLLNPWNEATVSWDTPPLFNLAGDGSLIMTSSTPPGILSLDITDLARDWFEGTVPNHGLVLIGNENANNLVAFHSGNYFDSSAWPRLSIKFVEGIVESYPIEEIFIPEYPEYPIMESSPITLGPRKKATFMVANRSDSPHVRAMIQVGFENHPEAIFFNASPWTGLKPQGYPGEAAALSTDDVAEFARVLVRGRGGEIVKVYPRTREG